MNRHNPTIRRTTVAGGPVRVYEQGNSARSIPAVVENHGSAVVRLLFTETGAVPDPDAYSSLGAGKAVECNPDTDIWAYSPSGVSCEVAVVTGVRHVGDIGATSSAAEAGAVVSESAKLLAEVNSLKQLSAEQVLLSRIMLRYFAQWEGDEYNASDALKI